MSSSVRSTFFLRGVVAARAASGAVAGDTDSGDTDSGGPPNSS